MEMDAVVAAPSQSQAALRWRLIRRSLLPSCKSSGVPADGDLLKVSRRPAGRFNLVPQRLLTPEESVKLGQSCQTEVSDDHNVRDVVIEYCLPSSPNVKVVVAQRSDGNLHLRDLVACQKNSIDSTGISCLWPAEEVLTFFSVKHPMHFKNKTVIELGSGYGLGGLAVAACTEAAEVVITDGNPLVMDYVRRNIRANCSTFGKTRVSELLLYWGRDIIPVGGRTFDLVIAADCTFFKDFHNDLARTVKSLLHSKDSRAIFFNPRRGDTLELFMQAAQRIGLAVELTQHYDSVVWELHQQLLEGDQSAWPNYDTDHSYPWLLSVSFG